MKIKSGFIAIIGKPNAGKSTLVNAIIKEKVSIVSPKAQTTRNNITGILNGEGYQLIFVDTPGINKIQTKLDEYMQKSIKGAVAGVDVIIIALDATKGISQKDRDFVTKYAGFDIPTIIAVTKIDELANEKLFLLLNSLNNLENVKEIIPLSAQKNRNIDELIKVILKYVPEIDENKKYYDEDMYTDKSVRFIISEIIREKALYFLNQEIPHGIAVEIVKHSQGEQILEIEANIICEKASHKGIIIGREGQTLKKIGHAARVSIQKVVRCKANLNLFVKVEENWRDKGNFLNDLGYDDKEI